MLEKLASTNLTKKSFLMKKLHPSKKLKNLETSCWFKHLLCTLGIPVLDNISLLTSRKLDTWRLRFWGAAAENNKNNYLKAIECQHTSLFTKH